METNLTLVGRREQERGREGAAGSGREGAAGSWREQEQEGAGGNENTCVTSQV